LPDECTREELAIRAGEHLTWERHAMSAVWGPTGSFCAEPLIDVEGVVYADIAVADRIAAKLMHDIVGSYNQHHVLSLRLDRSRAEPISFSDRSCRLPEVTAHWLDDLSPDA
jgi:aliphatic nitrilase